MKFHAALVTGIAGFVAMACAEGPMSPSARMSIGSAALVSSQITAGNPVCTTQQGQRVGLGYLGGTADQFTAASSSYTIQVPGLGSISYTTTAENDGIASWTSTFPIDGISMKGGSQGSNVYSYAGGATSGGGEFTAITGGSGTPAEISHINFCWYGRFTPSVDGAASYTRDYSWSIDKSANAPASVAKGSALTVSYTVAMSRSFTDSEFAINGRVSVLNAGYGASGALDGVAVDVGGVAASVICPVTFPATIANGASLECDYSAALPNSDTRTVTATVAASGLWRSSSASSSVAFGAPTSEIDETASVSDTRVPAGLGSVSGAHIFTYDLTTTAPDACVPVTIDNTASFVTNDNAEIGSDMASVTVGVTGCGTTTGGTAEELGTGFAYINGASTFSSLTNNRIKRWGWSLAIAATGSYEYDVYVGAGQNILSNGTNVGKVTINYTGTTVTATYDLLPNYVVMSEHLYAGYAAIPVVTQGNKTAQSVAPGQYTVNVNGGSIYVIAHSVIGYVQP